MNKPTIILVVSDSSQMAMDVSHSAASKSNGAVATSNYFVSTLSQRMNTDLTPTIITNVLCAERAKQYMSHAETHKYTMPLYQEYPVVITPVPAFYLNEIQDLMQDYPRATTKTVYIGDLAAAESSIRQGFLREDTQLDTVYSTDAAHIQYAGALLLDQIRSWMPKQNRTTKLRSTKTLSDTQKRLLLVSSGATNTMSSWRNMPSEMNTETVEMLTDALHSVEGDLTQLNARDQHSLLLGIYAAGGLPLDEFTRLTGYQLPLQDCPESSQMATHIKVSKYTYQAEIDMIRPHTLNEHTELAGQHAQFYLQMGYEMPPALRVVSTAAEHKAERLLSSSLIDMPSPTTPAPKM